MATKKASGTAAKKATTKSAATSAAKTSATNAPAEKAGKAAVAPERKAPTHQQIADLAYRYWEERGRPHGSHRDDWHRAEETLRKR